MFHSYEKNKLICNGQEAFSSTTEELSSKIKQIHFWYFWEKQVSLTEVIHMSMGKQNLEDFFLYICMSYLDLNSLCY